MSALTILSTSIKQDSEGRYSLNDCHRASGGDPNNAPAQWLRTDQAKNLIAEIRQNADLHSDPIRTVNGGKSPGTFGHRLMVYAYGEWISATFHLAVLQAFDDQVTGKLTLSSKPSVTNHTSLLRKAIALHGSLFVYNKRQGMDLTQARTKANAQVLEQMGVDLPKECGWQSQPLAIQEQVLTATDIAKALSLPGNKPGEAGNNLLDAAGLYSWTRDTKGRKVWTPTEHGRKFGRYEDKPRAHTSGTVQPWGWYPSVLDILRLHLATVAEARPFAKKLEPTS